MEGCLHIFGVSQKRTLAAVRPHSEMTLELVATWLGPFGLLLTVGQQTKRKLNPDRLW